jgi:c-di-GMP-binding flagellar brake protein YcgR
MTSLAIPPERRSHRRYSLEIPLRYRAANCPLKTVWKHGRALDMSAGGILIYLPEPVAIGTKLELAMDWTGLYHGRQAMRLFLVSAVARLDGRGVALRILSHRFRDIAPTRVRIPRADKNLAVA